MPVGSGSGLWMHVGVLPTCACVARQPPAAVLNKLLGPGIPVLVLTGCQTDSHDLGLGRLRMSLFVAERTPSSPNTSCLTA